MSRHGYSDDLDQKDLAMWRGRVASAIRGKRGQALLRDLRDALDAMPIKELTAGELIKDGEVCALGACGVHRGLSDKLPDFDPENHESLGQLFDVSPCLVQEIEYENDEWGNDDSERWKHMRKWVESKIAK